MSDARDLPGSKAGKTAPGPLIRVLHIVALWSFAVAQPLLDLLGRHAQFFVAQDSRPADIVTLLTVLCVLIPAGMALGSLAVGLVWPAAGRAIHLILIALLSATICLQLLRRLDAVPGVVWIAVALALGAAAATAYARFTNLRTYLSLLTPAPLVFAAIFLFFTSVKKLVWPEPVATTATAEIDSDTPVVMVVFDELSLPSLLDGDRRIDAVRYPNFAVLSDRAHWFRDATSTAAGTIAAMPAILTGRYLGPEGDRDRLATAASYPDNLFTLLGDSYQLSVFETMTNLCPHELCPPTEFDVGSGARLRHLLLDSGIVYPHTVLPADLAARLPAITDQWGNFAGVARKRRKRAGWREMGRKPEIFAAFLGSLRAGENRTLYFLHSGLPHTPYRFLPSGRSYGAAGSKAIETDGLENGLWEGDGWPVKQGYQRYLLQLGYVDRLLGELIATLEESGLWDRALVVVASDHGVSFLPGQQRRKINRHNFPEVMPVPLFVKLPAQREGTISDRNVELVDVLPTILDALDSPEPWSMDGVSVLDTQAPERATKRMYRAPYGPDSRLELDASALDAKYAVAKRMWRIFGPSDDPAALYRLGPFADLVGRRLVDLRIMPAAKAEVRLAEPDLYEEVDPASGFVPARVRGELRSERLREKPLHLAVAVGGTVHAVTRTLKTGVASAPFSAMVPESAFSPGRNEVEVFVVSGPAKRPRLEPTRR